MNICKATWLLKHFVNIYDIKYTRMKVKKMLDFQVTKYLLGNWREIVGRTENFWVILPEEFSVSTVILQKNGRTRVLSQTTYRIQVNRCFAEFSFT